MSLPGSRRRITVALVGLVVLVVVAWLVNQRAEGAPAPQTPATCAVLVADRTC